MTIKDGTFPLAPELQGLSLFHREVPDSSCLPASLTRLRCEAPVDTIGFRFADDLRAAHPFIQSLAFHRVQVDNIAPLWNPSINSAFAVLNFSSSDVNPF